MKKSLMKIVFSAVLLGMPLMAADSVNLLGDSKYDLFVGVEVGLSSAEFTDLVGDYENTGIGTYGVKVGAVNDNTRMYFSYQYMDAFNESLTREGYFSQATLNLEGLSKAYHVFDSISHYFFIGGHLGGINLLVDSEFGDSDEVGLVYGFQGGLISEFGFGLNLELGYRYSRSTFSDANTNLSKLEDFYAGLNYRF